MSWSETHHYQAEIEVPIELDSSEDLLDWVQLNTDTWVMGLREPFEIATNWDSFDIEE